MGSREQWGTRIGVILAVTGSAVGLGNFLRFPGVATSNGGGAFMIPYFVAFLLLGLPIAWVEWTMGRYGGARGFNSAPGIFRIVCGRGRWWAPYLGALALLIPVAIYMYYVYIEAWCLGYAWKYWSGSMADLAAQGGATAVERASAAKAHILDFAAVNPGGNGRVFTDWTGTAMPFLIICFVVNFILIYRGINKGIEWFCKWAMPALVVCGLIVLVRVLTLGTPDAARPDANVVNGLGFMWNPVSHALRDGQMVEVGFFEALSKPSVWLEAAGQIFFTLSIGFGIVLTYASYMRKDDDVALSSTTAAAGNGFCEVVLGGLITIPAAYLFLSSTEILGYGGSSFKVGFMALPAVFEHMPLGHFFGGLFFFLLFLAAVTSSLSMLQPAIALFEEGLGIGRRASVSLLGFITVLGAGFVVYLSEDLVALDTIDFWVGSVALYVLAMIQVVMFGWVMGIEKGMKELAHGADLKIPGFIRYIIKYVSPVYLILVFGAWIYQQLTQEGPDNRLSQIANSGSVQLVMAFIGLLLVLFSLLIAASVRRWSAQEAGRGEGHDAGTGGALP